MAEAEQIAAPIPSGIPVGGRVDFDYESRDVNRLRVGLQDLQQDDRRGLALGVATWLVSSVALHRSKLLRRNPSVLTGFFLGASAYNLYVHQSRMSYDRLASYVNLKYSQELSKIMKLD
eukprot:TRINITY_DN13969_c0_g1_i1.p1 TRINITY_DN13969_c0_g1~~TRINITY_DN13969_c0_g1_i1.p1  ORF type:complete len:119 (+),score=28.56 TRINITY_DN13969_c0_g1_i1:120-476(+)